MEKAMIMIIGLIIGDDYDDDCKKMLFEIWMKYEYILHNEKKNNIFLQWWLRC